MSPHPVAQESLPPTMVPSELQAATPETAGLNVNLCET